MEDKDKHSNRRTSVTVFESPLEGCPRHIRELPLSLHLSLLVIPFVHIPRRVIKLTLPVLVSVAKLSFIGGATGVVLAANAMLAIGIPVADVDRSIGRGVGTLRKKGQRRDGKETKPLHGR